MDGKGFTLDGPKKVLLMGKFRLQCYILCIHLENLITLILVRCISLHHPSRRSCLSCWFCASKYKKVILKICYSMVSLHIMRFEINEYLLTYSNSVEQIHC